MGASYALTARTVKWPGLQGLKQWRGADWAIAGASGAVLGISYPPVSAHFMPWVALVPVLLMIAQNNSWRRAYLLAATAYWTCYFVAFSWVLFHEIPSAAAALLSPLVILPLVHAVPFGVAVRMRNRWGPLAFHISLPITWYLCEAALANGPFALPWALLANTQADSPTMAQIAYIVGVEGLSLLILLSNQLLMVAVGVRRLRVVVTLAFIALIGGIFVYGQEQRTRPAPTSIPFDIGVVQPAIPAAEWADPDPARTIAMLVRLSEPLTSRMPDVIVWPETALRADLSAELVSMVQKWVDARRVPVLTGAVLTKEDSYTNSALLFTPGRAVQRYDKVRLVPMAEYVPLTDRVPFLKKLAVSAGGVPGYIPGRTVEPLTVGNRRVAPLICFESLFSRHARAFVEKGADVIFVLSQDGWWGRTFGFRQHFAYNRLRAIETRRPVVQVAVSGITGVILPDGNVLSQTEWMDRRAMVLRVPIVPSDRADNNHTK